jgi:hypothetical protein
MARQAARPARAGVARAARGADIAAMHADTMVARSTERGPHLLYARADEPSLELTTIAPRSQAAIGRGSNSQPCSLAGAHHRGRAPKERGMLGGAAKGPQLGTVERRARAAVSLSWNAIPRPRSVGPAPCGARLQTRLPAPARPDARSAAPKGLPSRRAGRAQAAIRSPLRTEGDTRRPARYPQGAGWRHRGGATPEKHAPSSPARERQAGTPAASFK